MLRSGGRAAAAAASLHEERGFGRRWDDEG